jgi:hypothetical protein
MLSWKRILRARASWIFRNSKNLSVIIEDVIHEKAFQRLALRLLTVCRLSEASCVDEILHQAEQSEKEYDWLESIEFYKKSLDLVSKTDFLKMGKIQERIGYAIYRTAMQAENSEQFREKMQGAIANYENAKGFYGDLAEDTEKKPRTLRCDAMVAYTNHWLVSDALQKKKLLDECWSLTKEALNAFKQADNALEYGKTYSQLSSVAYHSFALEWDFQTRTKVIGEAVEYGEQATTLLSGVADSCELAEAYAKTALYLTVLADNFISDMDEKERYRQKSLNLWQEAYKLSEEIALLELLSIFSELEMIFQHDELQNLLKKALSYAQKTKDRYLIGSALDHLAYVTFLTVSDDPEKILQISQEALQYAESANNSYSAICFVSPRAGTLWTAVPGCEYYTRLAIMVETDLKKKRILLEKAIAEGTYAIKHSENTGYPDTIKYANFTLSLALRHLGRLETNLSEKKALLEKALTHQKEALALTERIQPYHYWNLGFHWSARAQLRGDLSAFEKDSEKRKTILEEAISDREYGSQLYIKQMQMSARAHHKAGGEPGSWWANLGLSQYSRGELLNSLYELTSNEQHQRRAIKAFEEAVDSYEKANRVTRIAECYWKLARGYDNLHEYLKGAQNFDMASSKYEQAAENIPQLKSIYQNHTRYMEAWSEIEKARHHHERQEYGSAQEHFEKAADLHKSLKQWSYLAPNYAAWAQLERAEQLSRAEQDEEARKSFEQAARLFDETRKSIQSQFDKIEDADEERMATNMLKATDTRHEYCDARIAVEEAKTLDKNGDHYSSSERYGLAADTFERISQSQESDQEKREIQFIAILSRAWQKMTMAEAEASPALYAEASGLFEQARDYVPSEKTKMLVLGHSRFCKALEAGTEFADTRDQALHAVAVQHLASASNYYMKADFQTASEYAKATKLLFDAYAYMDNAEKESDPDKKAKLYAMIERVLQTSADSYTKAEHPEKREQMLKLLEKAKEEQELAASMTEALHVPSIVSATRAFASPTPTQEEAVGSERFEHADIQANLIVRQKEIKVGEPLNLEVELVNAGKGPAHLIKLAEVIPKGFDLTEKPEIYRVEDNHLNMKGKRLDPLKTEDVRLILKPKVQGAFLLKPKILYLDDDGNYKCCEPEPIGITVRELGIKGWLKG